MIKKCEKYILRMYLKKFKDVYCVFSKDFAVYIASIWFILEALVWTTSVEKVKMCNNNKYIWMAFFNKINNFPYVSIKY